MAAPTVSAAVALADVAGEEVSSTMFGLAQVISDAVKNVRENRDTALSLSCRIDELVNAVADGLATKRDQTGDNGAEGAVSEFIDILQRTKAEVEWISQQTYLSQLLHKYSDKARLTGCASTLNNGFQALMLHLRINASREAELSMQRASQATALTIVEALSVSDEPSPAAFVLLPPPPRYFFGRAAETTQIVSCLTDLPASGHVSILGGPGTGKTALALSVLHHPAVAARFVARRFFVTCDAAEGQTNCLKFIASSLGISAMNMPTVKRALRFKLSSDSPSLLVLDNFESAWEGGTQRSDAEGALQFLSDIPMLSLIVTLRGSDRPQGVPWTRPFMPPLTPISLDASKQLFLSICDVDGYDTQLERLLAHVENLPLAVTLMANLAQYNGIDTLLDEWERRKTAMLSVASGSTRLTSLDVSIGLSVHCLRMQAAPSSTMLLALLSLLPDGASMSDISMWMPVHHKKALSVLLSVALAYRPSPDRVQVLAPIRDYMLQYNALSADETAPLYEHYFALLNVIDGAQMFVSRGTDVEAIIPELGNVEFLIQRTLRSGSIPMLIGAVNATVKLCRLSIDTGAGTGTFEILTTALAVAEKEHMQEAIADLLRHWATMSFNFGKPGDPHELWRRAREIYETTGLASKAFTASSLLLAYKDAERAVSESTALCGAPDVANDPRKLAWALNCLGLAYRRKEMPREALSAYERSVSVIEQAGIRSDETQSRNIYSIGCCHIALGNNAVAVATFESLLTSAYADSLAPDGLADAHMQLGGILCEQGYVAKGLPHLKEAFSIYQKRGSLAVYLVLFYLCKAHLSVHDVDAACARLQAASQWGSDHGVHRAYILLANVEVAIYIGDLGSARALLDTAERLYKDRDPAKFYHYTQCLPMDLAYAAGTVSTAEGRTGDACTSFILLAVMLLGDAQVVQPVLRLTEIMDCDSEEGERLLAAVMVPLLHMGSYLDLAKAFLHSARLALQRGSRGLARHRAESALSYFQKIDNREGHIDVNRFIEQPGPSSRDPRS
ncbi:hypothetical protein AURDEDRAFT_188618 [Auricularia subglabra TFB-10046 SS5]|nr:hypothetical protein AURDEDRAFT_188618 [Auricularia subglabra TFB-10046 SS5]